MKNIAKAVIALAIVIPVVANAQVDVKEDKGTDRIIITRKGADTDKLNITIDGDNITVNGKPVTKGQEGDVTVRRMKIKDINVLKNDLGELRIERPGHLMLSEANNRPMLGVTMDKTDEGVIIKSVSAESAADKMGLKVGDIVTKVEGKEVSSPEDISTLVRGKKIGDPIKIEYKRDAVKNSGVATLGKMKMDVVTNFNFGNNGKGFEAVPFDNEDLQGLFKGLEKNYSFQYPNANGGTFKGLAMSPRAFGNNETKLGIQIKDAADDKGVVVAKIDNNSLADKAGLKDGDVIVKVGDKQVKNLRAASFAINAAKAKGKVALEVSRNGKAKKVEIVVPKKERTADL